MTASLRRPSPLWETMVSQFVTGLVPATIEPGADYWLQEARPEQRPPDGTWRVWLIQAGRGFGKSRSGAEFIRERVMAGRARRIALVAPTAADARDVMVEGPSGILAVCDRYGFGANYEPSKRRITFENGASATTFSADEPKRLRGPEHDLAWADELAQWNWLDRPDNAWANLQFGLRRSGPKGDRPQVIATTTPRPLPLIRGLVKRVESGDPTIVMTVGATYDNAANLDPDYFAEMRRTYEGTRLGRQELLGEILDDVEGALWTLSSIDDARLRDDDDLPELTRIVVAIDPAVSASPDSDETGILVCGRDRPGEGYVLEDLSGRYPPHEWATIAVAAYRRWRADRIVAEVNQGGDLVETTVRTVDRNVAYASVRASKGKVTRAEPVSSLYEQRRVHHYGAFPALEEQMTTYVPAMTSTSPDRMDALVYALTDLIVDEAHPEPPLFTAWTVTEPSKWGIL